MNKRTGKLLDTLSEKEIETQKEISEIVKDFPDYDESLHNWVGSKQYWESIFESETNRNPELHRKFSDLHKKLVNEVISFLKENELKDIDEFHLNIDGLMGSVEYGEWTCATDSGAYFHKMETDENGPYINRDECFLYQH